MSQTRHPRVDPLSQSIADRVAAEVTRRGRYRIDVAKAADISAATFSRKINAQTDFTVPELVRIAAVLEVDWTTFLPESTAIAG